VRSPRITKAEVELHFPSYLNRPPETTDQLNVEVSQGTRIEWRLQCDKPDAKLSVVHGDQRLDVDVDVGESGRDISFSLPADRNFTYAFEWTEATSGNRFQFKDVEYSVKTIKDAKPRITLQGRAPNGPATLGKKAAISWKARDDYGLDKIWLVYTVTVPGQNEDPKPQRILLRDVEGQLSDVNSHSWILAKDVPELEPGQQIAYYLEATDLSPDEKGERIARSRVHQISIVSNDDYIGWYRRQFALRTEVVKKTFVAEQDVSEQLKQLLSKPGKDQP
jgi:hypothetical protein